MRTFFSLVLALLLIGGCASKPTYRYYSSYVVEGAPGGLLAPEAAQAHMNAANSIIQEQSGGRYDNPIRLIYAPQPVTPPRATDDRIEGDVKVRILFGESGKVEKVDIVESPNELLTEAVLAAVRLWAITPATVNGRPAKFGARQAFSFKAGW